MTEISLSGRGARGESQADILRRTGQFGVLPTDTDAEAMGKLNAGAAAEADAAAASAAEAEGFALVAEVTAAGGWFDSLAAGAADVAEGEGYFVKDGENRFYTAQKVGGVGVKGAEFTTAALIRERLTGNRTYYVRTDGSDANDGLANTSGGAFLTVQRAVNAAYANDTAGYVVTIQIAAGTYSGPVTVSGRLTGATDTQPLRMIGDEATPANVVISATNNNAINLANSAYLLLAGVTTTVATSGNGWSVTSNAMFEHRNCRFGPVAGDMILTQHHATVRALGNLTVAGGGVTFCHATKRSVIDFAAKTITFTGSPVFSTYLWGLNDASVNIDSATIVGAVTGRTFVHDNALLNASSLTGSYLGGFAPEVNDGGLIAIADLMQSRTLYVRTDGNDANDGMVNTAGRAFKTIGAAVTYLAQLTYNPIAWSSALDSGFVIQVADGTYPETVNLRDVHFVGATIRGNEAAPANVAVAGVSDGFVAIGLNTKWYLRGIKITAAAGSGIRAEQDSQVAYQNVDFGTCSTAHVFATLGARAIATGNYAISGGAMWHLIIRNGSQCSISDRTITITGTPAFSQQFAFADDGAVIRATGMTFSGSATGKRYDVATNAVINTNSGGASYFPGNAAGSTATGGQYA